MAPPAWPPCERETCPVPDPAESAAKLRRLRTHTIKASTALYRGVKVDYSAEEFVPGVGNSRFAPMTGRSHLYAARTKSAALLESALHEASGVESTIYRAQLAHWELAQVALTNPVRLVDLRDEALHTLGLRPEQLTTAQAAHYGCTRAWAARLLDRKIGGHQTHGLLWTSRQAHIHASTHSAGLAGDLLVHRSIEVAIIWAPPFTGSIRSSTPPEPLLGKDGQPARIVVELANIIGTPIFG